MGLTEVCEGELRQAPRDMSAGLDLFAPRAHGRRRNRTRSTHREIHFSLLCLLLLTLSVPLSFLSPAPCTPPLGVLDKHYEPLGTSSLRAARMPLFSLSVSCLSFAGSRTDSCLIRPLFSVCVGGGTAPPLRSARFLTPNSGARRPSASGAPSLGSLPPVSEGFASVQRTRLRSGTGNRACGALVSAQSNRWGCTVTRRMVRARDGKSSNWERWVGVRREG